ncbi:MAG: glycoside hydrolase family 31 protein, partial [Acidimicrobiales bacterium]|nr:glycoside hydrolase family 31 protein [Acidimicrobiales bacterium]
MTERPRTVVEVVEVAPARRAGRRPFGFRTAAVVAALGLIAAACSGSDDAGAPEEPSTSLTSTVADLDVAVDDGRLVITDAVHDVTIRQAPVGEDPFNAGFRRGDTWTSARSLEESSATTFRWSTTDPASDLVVRFEPAVDGEAPLLQVLVEGGEPVDGVSIGFEAEAGERFVGFGERSNAVDQRGSEVEHYVAEGPYASGDYDAVRAVVPAPGLRERPDATYFPLPWLLSSRGYGMLVTDDARSVHHLDEDRSGAWSVEVDAPTLAVEVFTGEDPAEVLRHFTDSIGRQPDAGSAAVLGPWIQPGAPLDGPAAVVDWVRSTDTPTSVVQTYLHYLPCGDHLGRAPEERAQEPDVYHSAGMAVTTYFNPMVCREYAQVFDEAVATGALTRTSTGEPYVYDYFGSRVFEVGQFDFTSTSGPDLYRRLLRDSLDDGYDGWMEDFGEYTPLDAFNAAGVTGSAGHNSYAREYHAAAHEVAAELDRPLLRFVRSGWTGSAAASPIVWGGDPTTSWDDSDGLKASVTNGLTMGLSGVGIWGSDIGGFFTLTAPQLTPELLIRWIQFGAFSGVMRSQANGFGANETRPQIFADPVASLWRRYAKLRTQLHPYLAASAEQYRDTGMPLMRHHLLTDPDDAAAGVDDQYRFGDWLVVAPIVEPGATARSVVLPSGVWLDLTTDLAYDESTGAFSLAGSTVLGGDHTATIEAELEQIPLLVSAGAVISLLPADVSTLAEHHAVDDVVSHLDRQDQRTLLAFPRGTSTA